MRAKQKGSRWGIGLACCFASFALFVSGLAYIAVTRPMSLVSEGYYREGLAFQDRIDRVNRTGALPEHLSLTYYNDSQMVVIEFPGKADASTTEGTITFFRPSDARLDWSLPVAVDTMGAQRILITDLPRGVWRVLIDWASGGERYYAEKELVLR